MKHIIKLKAGQTVEDATDHTLEGKVVFMDNKGKVVKVKTQCGESKADQAFAESHDINRLIADAQRKGLLRSVGKFEGEMDDFPAYDFQEAQNMMAKAKSMFEAMPAGVRARFKKPAEFMQYVNNPQNRAELEKMGFKRGFDNLDYKGNIINPNYNIGINAGRNTDNNPATNTQQEMEAKEIPQPTE